MMRNDYRRSLILLRSNAAGFSGHVRLERRTLMGTMYFLLEAGEACPTLRVALVGKGRSGYYACAIGETQRDSRGQAVLSYNFDPRNICGHELEEYQLIAICCAGDESCEAVLYGNVCGHAELNWGDVRAALRGLYYGDATGAQPAPSESTPVTELSASPTESPAPSESAANPEPSGSNISTDSVTEVTLIPDQVTSVENVTEAAPDSTLMMYTTATNGEDSTDANSADRATGVTSEPFVAQGEADAASSLPAARALLERCNFQVNREPWPEAVEPLRELFLRESALNQAPDDGCVYVAAPMPRESGYAYIAAGLVIVDGALTAVRYALPAAWTQDAPAGLEDYAWVGDQNRGWWCIELPLDE